MSTSQADDAFERFVAGDDRLAALLRAVPAYEPPATMVARFAALARVAQNAYVPAAQLAASAALSFEPPASLEAGFLAEAARIQAAQQPRHDAVIEQIKAGTPAAEVLGHDVTAETAAWLADRPQRLAAKAQTQKPGASASRAVMSRWWQRAGVVAASVAFGAVATNLWLARRSEQTSPVAAAMNETPAAASVTAAEPAAPAAAKSSQPTTIALQVDPIAQVSAVGRGSNAPGATDSKERNLQRLREQTAEAKRLSRLAPDAAESGNGDMLAADKAQAEAVQERVREQEQKLDRRAERLALAKPAPAEERAMPPPPPALAGAVVQERMAAQRQAAPVASNAAPAAPAPAIAAAPAAAPAPAPAAAAPVQGFAKERTSGAMRFELGSSPQDAAAEWQALGHARPPRVFAGNPQSPVVRAWTERLRQALPADQRPAQISIARDNRLPADALRLE